MEVLHRQWQVGLGHREGCRASGAEHVLLVRQPCAASMRFCRPCQALAPPACDALAPDCAPGCLAFLAVQGARGHLREL